MLDDIHLTRREFLWLAALTVPAICLTACASSQGATTPPTNSDATNFYVTKKARIMKEANAMMKFVRQVIAESNDPAFAETIVTETTQRLEALLPDLSYIGGDANALTDNLCESAGALALYQTLQAHGKPVEEAGRILYRAVEAQIATSPMLTMFGSTSTGKPAQEAMEGAAAESQKRQYPGDWVFNFVPGDGKEFDYGVDYTECGICKLFHARGADAMTPYLCLLDFPMSQATGSGLVRTTTLARGGSKCDFRYKQGRRPQMDWVPDFLKRS